MLNMLTHLAWRNLWRNPKRTAITLIVVAAGLFSILSLNAMIEAWAASSRDVTLNLTTGAGQIHAPVYLDDPTVAHAFAPPAADGALAKTLNAAPITAWTQRLRISAVVQSEYRTLPVTLVGTDLGNDRPVSFTSDTALATADGGRFDPSSQNSGLGGTIAADLLFAGQLECASCHDVHNGSGVAKLLRKSNAGSALCLTCHDK